MLNSRVACERERHCNPYASVASPTPHAAVAGPSGVVFNRFGWLDPDSGQVSNVYAPATLLGLVLPQPFRYARNGWMLAYWDPARGLVLRSGMMITLAAQGDFWVRFPLGAQVGQQVWANQADGTPATGIVNPWTAGSSVPAGSADYTAGAGAYQATCWTAMTAALPGELALISSFAKPF